MSSPNDHKENALVLLGREKKKHYAISSIYSNTLQANGQHLPCDASLVLTE